MREQYPEDHHLYLTFYHRDRPVRLEVQQTRQNVADELRMSDAELLGLLRKYGS